MRTCGKKTNVRGQRGFMVIALITMVAIMLIYVVVSLRFIGFLRQDLRRVELVQTRHWQQETQGIAPTGTTNAVPGTADKP